MNLKSGNPALKSNYFVGFKNVNEIMTIEGTINKSLFLLLIVILSALFTWNNATIFMPYYLLIIIVGLIIGIIIIYKKETSPYLTPVYAFIEGIIVGILSMIFEKNFPGIVIQAVSLTFGVFASLLLIYKSGLIKATENFKLGITAATGGILIIYIISIIGNLSGLYNIPFIHESGLLGIGFSIIVVIIAALNLILDFDFIEKGSKEKVPKYMEWYASFGLLVTLIWLYIEILRLLSKLRSK